MKIDKKKIIYGIIISVLLIFLILACKKQIEEEKEPEPVTEPEPVPEPEPQPVEEKPAEDLTEEEFIKQADKTQTISGLRCTGTKIEGVITNIDSDTITLGRDVKILVNAKVVNPPDCEKLTLEPGESTFCRDVSGPYDFIIQGKINLVQLNFRSKRKLHELKCPVIE